ncbi:BTB/POZ domain-containing protein KCTD7-like [Styela clava]
MQSHDPLSVMAGVKPSSMNVLKIVDVPNPSFSSSRELNGNGIYEKNECIQFQNVITLNIGGTIHTTSLSTLLKYPDSMLAVMFSGRHHLAMDDQGRYFIDRDGKLFIHILNYLRENKMPPLSLVMDVYEEAQYYNITPLISALNSTCPVASDKIRRLFLDEVPSYDIKINALIEKAQQVATIHPDRVSKLLVCVYKEDSPITAYENSLLPPVPGERNPNGSQMNHSCDVCISFGPWLAAPDVYDLIHCIKDDVAKRGYSLECQCIGVCDKHLIGQFYCKRPIYEFKFKWW